MVVLVYSLFNSDDFKWGKTREVIDPEGEKGMALVAVEHIKLMNAQYSKILGSDGPPGSLSRQ